MKKIAFAFAFALIIFTQLSFGQTFVVSEAKKCKYLSGKKIRVGDTLNLATEFLIQDKGMINIVHSNEWVMRYFQAMQYKLDTLYGKEKDTKEFIKHDSIFTVLKDKKVVKCDFPYKFICTPIFGGVATSIDDNIKMTNNRRIETWESSVMLKWLYPVPYDGKYYVIIKSMFDEYIDMKIVQGSSFLLDLTPYRKHKAILYKITSEECRETGSDIIIMR